jgi:hypothetical protein
MGQGDPLAGCIAKVERAKAHFDSLYPEINAFLSGEREVKPYRLVSQVDAAASRNLWRVRIVEEPPIEWSTIVGDYVQNLRSALDYLVWVLVRANGYTPGRSNAFPIFDVEPPNKRGNGERGKWNRQVAGLHPGALGFIERCQPYHAADGPKSHVLAGLRTLSNEDKHRALLPTFAAIHEDPSKIKFKSLEIRDIRPVAEPSLDVLAGRPLKENDVAMEMPIEITGPNPEVKLVANLTLDVGFGKHPIPLKGLEQMKLVVILILGEARRFLGE